VTLRRIGLVARHVFKESVRDRVLYGIAAFAVLLVGASLLIGQLSAGEDVKIIKDLGLATLEAGGALMAIFIGAGLVSREIDRRSIYSLLAKPLQRWEFIVGKYLGLVLTIFVNVAAMTAALYAVLVYLDWQALPIEREAWDAPALDPRLLVAVVMIAGELALLTAVALFFSAFSSSALLSVVLTTGMLAAGWLSADLRGFGDVADVPRGVARAVSAVGWIVPAFSAFDVKAQVAHGVTIPAAFVTYTLLYATFYVIALIGASVAIFSRRDFR